MIKIRGVTRTLDTDLDISKVDSGFSGENPAAESVSADPINDEAAAQMAAARRQP
jgi:hypothetical protein